MTEAPDGKMYLSIVEDMDSRMMVGYAMSTRVSHYKRPRIP